MKDKLIIFDENTNPSINYYNKLGAQEKQAVDRFEKFILVNASIGRAKKAKKEAVRFLSTTEKEINKVVLEDLRAFLLRLKEAKFSDYTNNDIKDYVRRFLKENFKDWSERFNNFEDIKCDSEPQRKKKITAEDILSKEQVEKLVNAEPEIFWKTFLIVQYECALRTGETRKLKWDMLSTTDSEVYWLTITSKKNNQGKDKERIAPPLLQSIFYLDELKKTQKEQKNLSPYIFHSKNDMNAPISSGATSKWFSRLTKKVLGKSMTNYLLRHSRGEAFHILVRDNKMSKENATEMLGHSEKMFDKTYSHPDKKLLKEALKKQVLNIGYIAPEKKQALEIKVEMLEKTIASIQAELKMMNQIMKRTKK